MKCRGKELVSYKKRRVTSWNSSARFKVNREFCEIIEKEIESIVVGIAKVIAYRNANVSSFKCEYLSMH